MDCFAAVVVELVTAALGQSKPPLLNRWMWGQGTPEAQDLILRGGRMFSAPSLITVIDAL